jgi:galactose mutarotase-like enzyme
MTLRIVLEDGPETRRHSPFAFSLALETELTDAAVRLDYRVAAGPENTAAMPFTIGNHITFRVPLTDRASAERQSFGRGSCSSKSHGPIGSPFNLQRRGIAWLAPARPRDP